MIDVSTVLALGVIALLVVGLALVIVWPLEAGSNPAGSQRQGLRS